MEPTKSTRAVLAQRQVNGAPGEVPGFAPLLVNLDLAGVVVTADALKTHRDAAEFLGSTKQADYLFTVKANQPVGARYSVTSGGLRVLMDQPTEPISSHDPPSRHGDRWLVRP